MEKKVNTQIRLPQDLHKVLKELSYQNNISINQLMITAIQEYVNVKRV